MSEHDCGHRDWHVELAGSDEPDERRDIILACPHCREDFLELDQLSRAVGDAFEVAIPPEDDDALVNAVMAAARVGASDAAPETAPREPAARDAEPAWRRALPFAVAAAAALAVVGAYQLGLERGAERVALQSDAPGPDALQSGSPGVDPLLDGAIVLPESNLGARERTDHDFPVVESAEESGSDGQRSNGEPNGTRAAEVDEAPRVGPSRQATEANAPLDRRAAVRADLARRAEPEPEPMNAERDPAVAARRVADELVEGLDATDFALGESSRTDGVASEAAAHVPAPAPVQAQTRAPVRGAPARAPYREEGAAPARQAEAASTESVAPPTVRTTPASRLLARARSARAAGNCRAALSDYDTVINTFRSARELPSALLESADCQRRLGQLDDAARRLRRAARYATTRTQAERELATIEAIERERVRGA
ncbi:MAG: hypothetical protein AAF411_30560, partial [Myxococcota bacterium]